MMNDTLVISGGNKLNGSIKISGAKNAALPLLAATLLTNQPIKLSNVPNLTDVTAFKSILKKLGVCIHEDCESLTIRADAITQCIIDHPEAKSMRASVLFLGPLLSRFGEVEICLPGGCNIGDRPIDQHIQALSLMGATFQINNKKIHAKNQFPRLKGADITLKMPTVTGTENIIMAATLASGITTIHNAAREPEILDLVKLLNQMGAKISGAGTSTIQVIGVDHLNGAFHEIIPDRIETATYLVTALATNSMIEITNTCPKLLEAELDHFKNMGANIEDTQNTIRINPCFEKLKGIDLTTMAYPGFSTDLQAPTMLLHSLVKGRSTITETVFDNRLHHVKSLNQMNANLEASGNRVICQGNSQLTPSKVIATDLRASACLSIAGLVAKGESYIHKINYIDRGYSQFDEKLISVGAKIKRIKCKDEIKSTVANGDPLYIS